MSYKEAYKYPSPNFYCSECKHTVKENFDYGIEYVDGGGDNYVIYVTCLVCGTEYCTGYLSPDN